jgi:signal transduction histidine kinase
MCQIVTKAIEKARLLNNGRTLIFDEKLNDHGFMVVGDYDRLFDMVSALLNNAVKFSKPHTKIDIDLALKNHFVHLKITDEGKGIPQQELDEVFAGFYKSKHNREELGMGIGLLLAKHVVSFHKGKIHLTSKENKGTTVEVALPSVKM